MSTIHFLFVDYEESFLEPVAERLRLRAATVDISLSGTEALNRLEECNTIDVVVLDIQMPDQNGIEILKRIKEKYPLIEVIILTGNATVQSAIEAMKCGAFEYLMKPCNMDTFLASANNAASRKRDRENRIFNIKSKPYISTQKKKDLISKILEE